MAKWDYLIEADDRHRTLERAWQQSGSKDDLRKLAIAYKRVQERNPAYTEAIYNLFTDDYQPHYKDGDTASMLWFIRPDPLSPYTRALNAVQPHQTVLLKVNKHSIKATSTAALQEVIRRFRDRNPDEPGAVPTTIPPLYGSAERTILRRPANSWTAWTIDNRSRESTGSVSGLAFAKNLLTNLFPTKSTFRSSQTTERTLIGALNSLMDELGLAAGSRSYPSIHKIEVLNQAGRHTAHILEASEAARASRSWTSIERRKRMKHSFLRRVGTGAAKGAVIGGGFAGAWDVPRYIANRDIINNLPPAASSNIKRRMRRNIGATALTGAAWGAVTGGLAYRRDKKTLKRMRERAAIKREQERKKRGKK